MFIYLSPLRVPFDGHILLEKAIEVSGGPVESFGDERESRLRLEPRHESGVVCVEHRCLLDVTQSRRLSFETVQVTQSRAGRDARGGEEVVSVIVSAHQALFESRPRSPD